MELHSQSQLATQSQLSDPNKDGQWRVNHCLTLGGFLLVAGAEKGLWLASLNSEFRLRLEQEDVEIAPK